MIGDADLSASSFHPLYIGAAVLTIRLYISRGLLPGFHPLYIGAAVLTGCLPIRREGNRGFHPLYIGAAVLTDYLDSIGGPMGRFPSPLHRGCGADGLRLVLPAADRDVFPSPLHRGCGADLLRG